jgi:hypothetical protein
METFPVFLLVTGLLTTVVGPHLIQIRNLANRNHKQFEDGHERTAIRERHWYQRRNDPESPDRRDQPRIAVRAKTQKV